MNYILRRAAVPTEHGWQQKDIVISNKSIRAISPPGSESGEGMDAKGLAAFPGLIDVHVHLNEPGRTDWEGMHSGSKALAAGGVTTYFDMPLNSAPPTSTAARLKQKQQLAEVKSCIPGRFWGALMPTSVESLQEMHEARAIGFKAFMSRAGTDDFHHADDETLLRGMEKIAALGSILAVHAESDHLINWLTTKAREESRESMKDYEQTRPIQAEVEAVERVLLYAEWTGCRTHICHISSGAAAEDVRRAKDRGVAVTAETCPHYLSISLEEAEEIGTLAKCAPPLRTEAEREKLWQALEDGTLDLISSDHSPAPAAMRDGTVLRAWGGIAGAQQTMDVLLTEGLYKRGISPQQLIQWTHTAPAAIFGLHEKRGLTEGSSADITLVDLSISRELREAELLQKHKESPYIGRTFRGKVVWTMAVGQIVFEAAKQGERM
ncbi:allantoinase AllB [Bacillus daqingensis]|uniref:Allantoinase AllB n=1 Tax=Bacillus daqingensis TaxID=872396 RepID=A0ABV9NZ13_9BACI